MYADDVLISNIIKTEADCLVLQHATDKLKNWCEVNSLHLNLNKCSVMSINRGRESIINDYTYGDHIFERVTEMKLLGVLFDKKLSFAKHIDMVTSKASAALGFVKRFCYDIRDTRTLKSLYYALVQSHLEYCSTVWLPFHKVYKDKIESIQKQFTMFALKEYPSEQNQFRITPYDQRLSKLGMTSLRRRRVNASMTYAYDVLNGTANCPLVRENVSFNPDRALRHSERIKVTDKHMKLNLEAPITQVCKIANMASDTFVSSASRKQFVSSTRRLDDATFGSFCTLK